MGVEKRGAAGWRRGLPLAVACVVLLAACGGSPSAGSGATKHGDRLTVAYNIEPDTLDPAAQTTTAVGALVNMVVETLVRYDANDNLVPGLATGWKVDPAGTSYRFTLRSGVKFQDGTPFNAAAVKYSLDRLNSPTTFKSQPGVLKVIKDVQVIDAGHVRVDLSEPFAPFLAAMTQVSAGIVSPASMDKDGNTPATIVHPVGTGPYSLAEHVTGDHVLLNAFPGYWGTKPAYASQLFKILPEASSRESLVKAGQADVAFSPPPNDLAGLRADGNLQVMMLPSDRTIFVAIDNQDPRAPQLANKEVRQALNYAINREAMIKNLTYGTTKPMDAPMASALTGYCRTGSYGYDPNKAKQLLKQAGATNLTLTFRAPQGRYTADFEAAQAITGDLRAVGVKVNLPNPPDWRTYVGLVNVPPAQATQDLHFLGWAAPFLDASGQMVEFQKAQIPPGGLNTEYYSNPQVERLLSAALTEQDKAKRAQEYCSASKMIWDDAPWIFLWTQENPTLVSSKVKGVYGLGNEQVITTWAHPA